jgi:hypothetical protein
MNQRQRFTPIEKKGKFFPDWINTFTNSSGVYIIRRRSDKKILYIGESHTGNLAKTIKRHFWKWSDAPERPHNTYEPDEVEIAIRTSPQKAARSFQNRLIRRYLPRDNREAIPAAEKESRDYNPDLSF